MASLLSLFGVILWSLAAFRPLGETLGTLPSHRSEVVSYYVECLLRASQGDVCSLFVCLPTVLRPVQCRSDYQAGQDDPLPGIPETAAWYPHRLGASCGNRCVS